MQVKLTVLEDGSIKAESPRQVLGYFDDMTIGEVREYLVDQAVDLEERVFFVTEFEEHDEHVNFRHLMKGKKKK